MANLNLATLSIKVAIDKTNVASELNKIKESLTSIGANGQTGLGNLKNALLGALDPTKSLGANLGSLKSTLIDQVSAVGGLQAAYVALAVAGIAIATKALLDFIKASVQVGVAFEKQMSKVEAISGSTTAEMKLLSDKAKEVGKNTVLTASQAGEAMEYMAMAGWKVGDMLAGIEPLANLAIVNNGDLGRTSDIVTDALTAFGMSAEETARFCDVLAQASSNSNTNVDMMGETFKYCAAAAGAAGYSIEDVALATGLMANSGVKASMAGTALRRMFTELATGCKVSSKAFGEMDIATTNSDGSMRELKDVILDLREAFDQMSESEKIMNAESIAGKTGMSGFLAVINAGEADFNKLADAIDNSAGATDRMAKTMADNVDGLLKGIESKWESVQIATFEMLEPIISRMLMWVDAVLGAFSNLYNNLAAIVGNIINIVTAWIEPMVATFNALVELLSPILDVLFEAVNGVFGRISESMNSFIEGFKSVLEGIKLVLEPVIKVIASVLRVALGVITLNMDMILGGFQDAADGATGFFTNVQNVGVKACNGVIDALNLIPGVSINKMQEVQTNLEGTGTKATETAEATANAIKAIQEELENKLKGLDDVYKSYMDARLAEYEKELKEKYDMTDLQDVKRFNEKLDKYKERLQREVDLDRVNEEKKLQLKANAQTKMLELEEAYSNKQAEMSEKQYQALKQQYEKIGKLQKAASGSTYTTMATPNVGGYATGTNYASQGWHWVGEKGRELMYFGGGEKVINNQQSEKLVSGGETHNTYNVNISADSVKEFVDVVEMCNNAQVNMRMGWSS